MNHIQHEALQRYIVGEADQAEAIQVEDHLAQCDECRSIMEVLTADDRHLSDALLLSQIDREWVKGVDLWPTVKAQISPWYLQPQGYLLIITVLAACGWVLNQTMPLVIQTVLRGGPVDLLIRIVRNLVPALLQLVIYLDRGGILANIWPLPLLVGIVYLYRKRRSYSHA